jgi:hypothetical protein
VRINESPSNIVELSAIRRERHRALSPYGPVRAGLTTLLNQETVEVENEARLMELLNSLESAVAILESKSYTALDTLVIAIEGARVALLPTTEEAGTDIV